MWLCRSLRTAAHPHRDVHMLNVCVLWSLRQSVLQMALVTCGSWPDHVFGVTDMSAASEVIIVTRNPETAAFLLPDTSDRMFSSGISQGGSFKNTGIGLLLVWGATPDARHGLMMRCRVTKLLPKPGRKKVKTSTLIFLASDTELKLLHQVGAFQDGYVGFQTWKSQRTSNTARLAFLGFSKKKFWEPCRPL